MGALNLGKDSASNEYEGNREGHTQHALLASVLLHTVCLCIHMCVYTTNTLTRKKTQVGAGKMAPVKNTYSSYRGLAF